MSLSGVPPLCPNPQQTSGHYFLGGGANFWSRLSRHPRITVKANYTQNKYCHKWKNLCLFFFFHSSATVASRDSLPVIQFKEKDFQNGAGAKCCGGEEGVCEECVWRCVPKRCQRGGILKQHSLSSSSVILSLHSQMSEFCLPLSFSLLQPSHSHSCDRQHNKNTNLCLLMSTVGDPTIWECLNQWTVLN